MPFRLFLLLGLVEILASLPAEPHGYPWPGASPYGIGRGPGGPESPRWNEARIEDQVLPLFGRRNFTRSRGEQGHGLPPAEEWGGAGQRGGTAPHYPDRGFRNLGPGPAERHPGLGGHGGEFRGGQSFEDAYSSHVDCEVPEQNAGAGGDVGPAFGPGVPGSPDQRINFDEAQRRVRTGTSREGDAPPRPRIIAPKGGARRPAPGSPGKNQSKPPGRGVTNTIPTTEKTFRNQTQKGSKRPRPNAAKPQGGDIVFPDGYRRQKFTPRLSECGKRATFCEALGEDYPRDYISQVLKKEGAVFKEFFGQDVISDPNITERINAPEENSLCPYRQEVVFPRAAQNREDKWLFIVNQDQYVQGVTVEVCLNPESRCILTEGFPLGYTPYCKQKYIERRLVAIGEDGKPHSDSFRLPSCCSCVVKHESSARAARSPRAPPAS